MDQKNENSSNNETKKTKKIFDLEERTAKFGEDIIEFTKKIPNEKISENKS
jgi:hypothetical protein